MAAQIKKDLGYETELRVGNSGEFTVWLGDKLIAEKKLGMFPSPEAVVAELRLAAPAS